MNKTNNNEMYNPLDDNNEQLLKTVKNKKTKRIIHNVAFLTILMATTALSYKKGQQSNLEMLDEVIDYIDITYNGTPPELKLGDLLEEQLGYKLDNDKKSYLNQCSYIAQIKWLLDYYKDNNVSEFKKINNKILVNCLQDAKNYMEQVIYHDNENLDKNRYYINFDAVANNGYIVLDEVYEIPDKLLNDCIISYSLLNKRNTDLSDHLDSYEDLINGLLKMTICDVKLNSSLISDHVDVEIPKKLVKIERKADIKYS